MATADANLKPGLSGAKTITVAQKHIAPHVPVFSTPALVALFETTSSQLIRAHLPAGRTSVGFEVNIRHLGPAPLGAQVTARPEVTAVIGNRVHFSLVAHCGEKKIGEGTYICGVVRDRSGQG